MKAGANNRTFFSSNGGFAESDNILVTVAFMAAGDLFAGVLITCRKGVITEISYYGNNPAEVCSEKALVFVENKAKQAGLSSFGKTIMHFMNNN